MMRVTVDASAGFRFSPPAMVFDTRVRSPELSSFYDVAPDGRFLVIKPVEEAPVATPQIVLVLNWHEELKRSMSAGN